LYHSARSGCAHVPRFIGSGVTVRGCAVSLGAVENLDQSQKSESARISLLRVHRLWNALRICVCGKKNDAKHSDTASNIVFLMGLARRIGASR
jgi:hypothetical protein